MPMQAPAASTGATTPGAAADTGPSLSRHHRGMRAQHTRKHGRHMSTAARRGGQSSDHVADQLNREEASRIASGNMATGSSTAPAQTPQPNTPPQGGSMQGQPMSGAPMSNPPASAGQMR
jgi:hypothetical protein